VSSWLVVWLVVGLVSTAALIAVAVWLVRHVILIGRSVGRVTDELGPITEEISRQSASASDRAAKLRMPSRHGRSSGRR
jgi:hypothetical protein